MSHVTHMLRIPYVSFVHHSSMKALTQFSQNSWCLKSIFFSLNWFPRLSLIVGNLVNVTAVGLRSPRGTFTQVLRSTFVDTYMWLRPSRFYAFKIVNFWVCYNIILASTSFGIIWLYINFLQHFLAKDHWWVFKTRNAWMINIGNSIWFILASKRKVTQ